jgi:hypothetical protein
LRYGLSVVAEYGIESAVWIITPRVDQFGADGRADGVAQRTLSIDDGYCLGNVASSGTASPDTILKPVAGFAQIVQPRKNRQPRNMHVIQFKARSRTQPPARRATMEHRINAMGDIKRMPDERARCTSFAISFSDGCHEFPAEEDQSALSD